MSHTTPDEPLSNDPLPEHWKRSQTTAISSTSDAPSPFATIFRLLKRRLRVTLLLSLGVAILVGAGSYLIKPYFTAVASFIPPTGGPGSGASAMLSQLSSMSGGLGGGLLGGMKSNADLYSGILKSRTVAQRMIAHFNLMALFKVKKQSIAEKILAGKTEVTIGTKDGIVTVKVTDTDPVLARDMANYYLDSLREASNGMALSQSSQQRLFYEDRLRREKEALSNAEIALKQNQEKSGLVSPMGQTSSQLMAIAQLRSQVAARETELATLRTTEAEGNPDIISVKTALDSLRSQINRLQSGNGNGRIENFSTSQVPALTLDYVRLERDVKYHETLFQIIAKQYETYRLTEADDPPLQILDHAVTPDIKAGPHHSMIALVTFVLTAIGISLWTILQASRRGEIDWSQFAA